MTDMLRAGMAWLNRQRTAHMTTNVTVRRSGEGDETVAATWGQTEYDLENEFGVTASAHVVDFVISASAWPFDDDPQPGDRIIAEGVIYEVLDLGGTGHLRWSDPFRTTMRIHTQEVGAE